MTELICGGCGESLEKTSENYYECRKCGVEIDDTRRQIFSDFSNRIKSQKQNSLFTNTVFDAESTESTERKQNVSAVSAVSAGGGDSGK